MREKEEQIRELQEHLDSSTKDREREISAFKEKVNCISFLDFEVCNVAAL